MAAFIRCPECARRFRLPQSDSTDIHCPFCDALVDFDEDEGSENDRPRSQRTRPRQGSNKLALVIAGMIGCSVLFLLCAGVVGIAIWRLRSSSSSPAQAEDYAQARQGFQTQLIHQGPAPQRWQNEQPPAGVNEVPYQSGNLQLRAWVNAPPAEGGRLPAVLFLHGGFAFAAEDWEQAEPFRDAGFVVMTPMLRGENGLPGSYSMFYNEVEDVLAAAEMLAQLPYVDSNRIYVAGHSAGGTLTMLAAMTSKRFRAAASFSGSPDQNLWARMQPQGVPFNPSDLREYQMRSPVSFPSSFKCPLRIFYGNQEFFLDSESQRTAHLAKAAGLDVEAVSVLGDHMTMVEPAMKQAIDFFKSRR